MPRIGMNPSRGKQSDYQPARVTVAVLTYIPNQVGYFKYRFDVIRACLESILAHTTQPYDLMVFDNGSCDQAVNFLQSLYAENKIDFLLLSGQNIGKIGALQIISRAAPGEVIAYSDDDVFFLPGWLESHLEILDTYPRVGLVTGFYIKSHMDESIHATMQFSARQDVKVEKGDLVDEEVTQHYIEQTGRTLQKYQQEMQGLQDVHLEYKGVPAFVSAGHHQFVCFKQVLMDALPNERTPLLMGLMRQLDATIDGMDLLRLSTSLPVTRLLGNLIDPQSAAFLREYKVEVNGVATNPELFGWQKKLYGVPLVQKAAYFFYERLFRIINFNRK